MITNLIFSNMNYKLAILTGFFFIFNFSAGCGDSKISSKFELQNEYLIKVGDSIATINDFKQAFEIAKTAYSQNSELSPADLKEIKFKLLNEMIDETVIIERAKELQMQVADSEIDNYIEKIKKDYPDMMFEQMFLENAVSYHLWKKKLKNRLLIDKVIAEDIQNYIEITSDDIFKYYEEYCNNESLNAEKKDASQVDSEIIIKYLRGKKSEEKYNIWISELKNRYTIKINNKQLEKMEGF